MKKGDVAIFVAPVNIKKRNPGCAIFIIGFCLYRHTKIIDMIQNIIAIVLNIIEITIMAVPLFAIKPFVVSSIVAVAVSVSLLSPSNSDSNSSSIRLRIIIRSILFYFPRVNPSTR